MKKLLAMALALVMALGVTTMAWAEEEGEATSGKKIAKVNDTEYSSFDEVVKALNQLPNNVQATLTLLDDVTDADMTIHYASDSATGMYLLNLDLNGHTFAGKLVKTHDLTVKDSSDGPKGTAHFSYVECNVLTLESGTVTIDDAAIDHTTIVTNANVTINNGEFKNRNHEKAIDKQEGSGSVTVNGGEFWTDNNLAAEGNSVIGYATVDFDNTTPATHYVIGKTTQGSCTIQKTSTDGTKLYFYDLSTAAKAAADGDVITLLADQTIDRKVEVKNSVTIDGNGKSIALAGTVKGLPLSNYSHGVFVFSGEGKSAAIKEATFKDIERDTVLLRSNGSNSTFTVEDCTVSNVKVMNVVRAASESAQNSKLVVTNSTFNNCTASLNGIIQIDNNSTSNAASEVTKNDFIGNKIGPADNVAVIYLSAPATVQNNYFDGNATTANTGKKNGIVVTGSKAEGSRVENNAFVSHTFVGGDAQGAVYGAKGATTVSSNYYGTGIDHLAKAGTGFTEGTVASSYTNMGSGNHSYTPARYYYNSTTTTDTKKDDSKSSPKTFDAGMGIYALTAVLSVTGMAYVGKKKF